MTRRTPWATACCAAPDKATSLLAQGELEQVALKLFQVVARGTPREPMRRQKAAELLQRMGRTAEAIAEYESVAETWAKTGRPPRAIARGAEGHSSSACTAAAARHRVPAGCSPRAKREQPLQSHAPAGRRGGALPTDQVDPDAQQSSARSPRPLMAPIPFFSSLGREGVPGGARRSGAAPVPGGDGHHPRGGARHLQEGSSSWRARRAWCATGPRASP